MTHIKTTQITFGKKTKRQLKKLAPSAKTYKKVGDGYLIKNALNETVATWHPQRMSTGLIILW